jgi:hypothetical protein
MPDTENAPATVESIPELIGQPIVVAQFVEHGRWSEVVLTTADGHVLTVVIDEGEAKLEHNGQPVKSW